MWTCEAGLAWQSAVVVPRHLVVSGGTVPSKIIVIAATPKSTSTIVNAKT